MRVFMCVLFVFLMRCFLCVFFKMLSKKEKKVLIIILGMFCWRIIPQQNYIYSSHGLCKRAAAVAPTLAAAAAVFAAVFPAVSTTVSRRMNRKKSLS